MARLRVGDLSRLLSFAGDGYGARVRETFVRDVLSTLPCRPDTAHGRSGLPAAVLA